MTTKIKTADGKTVTETTDAAGNVSVAIEVNRLEVPRETPEDKAAAEAIERLIPNLGSGSLVVIHAPSCQFVQANGRASTFRAMANLAVRSFVETLAAAGEHTTEAQAIAELIVVVRLDAAGVTQVFKMADFLA